MRKKTHLVDPGFGFATAFIKLDVHETFEVPRFLKKLTRRAANSISWIHREIIESN